MSQTHVNCVILPYAYVAKIITQRTYAHTEIYNLNFWNITYLSLFLCSSFFEGSTMNCVFVRWLTFEGSLRWLTFEGSLRWHVVGLRWRSKLKVYVLWWIARSWCKIIVHTQEFVGCAHERWSLYQQEKIFGGLF